MSIPGAVFTSVLLLCAGWAHLTMATDLVSKTVLILCDFDALYAAIELQLSHLSDTRLIRLEQNGVNRLPEPPLKDSLDLMIVATVSSAIDPVWVLSQASLLDRIGKTPVLVISEQPSRPESDDKITYLNFPFDIDQLTATVKHILDVPVLPAS